MKHDNHEVAIKIVFDKDSREILGAQMVSRDSAISMGIHMFSLAIQEHVTIDKLALTDLFFLPHFNKPSTTHNGCSLQLKNKNKCAIWP